MSEDLVKYLKQYQKKATKSLYVFPGHTGGPMGLTEAKRTWKKAKNKIDKWFEENKKIQELKFNLTFRLLRHTFCTGLFDAGIDELSAAEIMGHDVSIMREVYTHIQGSRRKQTVAKLNNLYSKQNVVEINESK